MLKSGVISGNKQTGVECWFSGERPEVERVHFTPPATVNWLGCRSSAASWSNDAYFPLFMAAREEGALVRTCLLQRMPINALFPPQVMTTWAIKDERVCSTPPSRCILVRLQSEPRRAISRYFWWYFCGRYGQKWAHRDCVAAFALPISNDVEAHVGKSLFSHAGDCEINSQPRGKNNGESWMA